MRDHKELQRTAWETHETTQMDCKENCGTPQIIASSHKGYQGHH